MANRIKVYEEKSRGASPWLWLLPLLLLLALVAFFLLRHHPSAQQATSASTTPAAAAAGSFPSLGTVHFDTDQATLSADDQATLDRAADVLKTDSSARLRVEGYTDSAGSDTHNLSLSQRRAIAVGTYLKSKGVDSNRLSGEGFGDTNPTDTNSTAAGKADNRRVELYSQQ